MLPNKTMKFKGEQCVGGKMSKDRITILVAANMTGTEKIKLLVIGKAKSPRCFKNVKSLPVDYESNSKAWMLASLFEKTIRKWDYKLFRQNKKMLLLLDNCSAHPKLNNLKAIKLVFLPANTTSKLQPMDQGVIKALKTEFRKLQLTKILEHHETSNKPYKLNMLEAIIFISEAWDRVSKQTISRCFRHAGFTSQLDNDSSFDEEENLPLSEWLKVQRQRYPPEDEQLPLTEWIHDLPIAELTSQENWENFVGVDEVLATTNELTDPQILADQHDSAGSDEEEEDGQEIEYQRPDIDKVYSAIKIVRNFFVFNNDREDVVNPTLGYLENMIEKSFLNSKKKPKQTKLTDFFNTR